MLDYLWEIFVFTFWFHVFCFVIPFAMYAVLTVGAIILGGFSKAYEFITGREF